jgi:hypothetical protein
VSEGTATVALLELINSLETGIANAKKIIKEAKLPEPKKEQHPGQWINGPGSFNMEKIPWTSATGNHGAYEKSTAFDNLDHAALLKYLGEHKGNKATIGNFFVWVFSDNKTIGRKPSKRGP